MSSRKKTCMTKSVSRIREIMFPRSRAVLRLTNGSLLLAEKWEDKYWD